MALLGSGRRAAARTPLLPAQERLPLELPVLWGGAGLYSWGWKALDPPSLLCLLAGLFFPGNVNNGVQDERCGRNLLWHRVFPGKPPLSASGGVQSEASMSPEEFNFSVEFVCTKGTVGFSQGGAATLDSPCI